MKSSTLTIENNKNFDLQVKLISHIESLSNTTVELINLNNKKVELNKEGLKLDLKIDSNQLEAVESLNFKLNNKEYIIKNKSFGYSSKSVKIDSNINYSESYSIQEIESATFNKFSVFQAFYPVNLNRIKSFHNEFETVTYQSNGTEYFYDCLRVELNKKQFDITQFKTEETGFYVIESFDKLTFESFRNFSFIIRQAVGFINGFMTGDEEYIFNKKRELYYSNNIRSSIDAMYKPIITNPYSRPDIDREKADHYFDKLTRISSENISNLAEKIYSNEELSVSIILLLESTSIRSLLIIPSIFSVIIESLSKIISIPECGLEYPIKDKNLKKSILKDLKSVIEDNTKELGEKSSLKLKQRLSAINNPVNKQHLTNLEKLLIPFEQLKINLSEQDILAIEHRNDLLHGNILFKNENKKSEKETNTYMAYISAKLYTLISKLILKHIGYNGYIYNQSKYLEKYLKLITKEEYFEKI